MSEQEYEFFATGRTAPPPVPPPPPAGSRPQFTDPQGRAVNQFGTPIDAPSVPVGPAAAPGYAAQPFAGPTGLTATGTGWGPPAPHRMPPGAIAVADRNARPGTVLAAGVVAIVQGVLGVIIAVLGFAAVSVLESSVQQVHGVALATVSGFVRLILFLVLAVGVLYLVAGIGTAVGKRWAVWTLVVVEAVGLVMGLVGLVDSSAQTGGALGQLVSLAVPVAVLVLVGLPQSRAWMLRR